ncbi:MAG: hypothetical protein HQL73_05940 [Magnetococcales bacterium]|nr:hypothetical protein [Magnetococcales bacterium]
MKNMTWNGMGHGGWRHAGQKALATRPFDPSPVTGHLQAIFPVEIKDL